MPGAVAVKGAGGSLALPWFVVRGSWLAAGLGLRVKGSSSAELQLRVTDERSVTAQAGHYGVR